MLDHADVKAARDSADLKLTTDIVHLARSLQLDELDSAWAQAAQSPDPNAAGDYTSTIDVLCEQGQASRALPLATTMVDALSGKDELDAAIVLAMTVVRRGAHNESLARNLTELLQRRFGEEDWWDTMSHRAGLDPAAVSAQSLLEFDKLRQLTKGHVVYHPAGWGEATVEEFHADRKELTIQFANGRRDDFPLDTIIDSFKPLAPDDLRAMKLQQMDELKRLAKEEPAVLIRLAAKLYRGTIQSPKVKAELTPDVIPDKSWASFWKRAKTAATKDPWLKVEGSGDW